MVCFGLHGERRVHHGGEVWWQNQEMSNYIPCVVNKWILVLTPCPPFPAYSVWDPTQWHDISYIQHRFPFLSETLPKLLPWSCVSQVIPNLIKVTMNIYNPSFNKEKFSRPIFYITISFRLYFFNNLELILCF